jgi:hypothetical protein
MGATVRKANPEGRLMWAQPLPPSPSRYQTVTLDRHVGAGSLTAAWICREVAKRAEAPFAMLRLPPRRDPAS